MIRRFESHAIALRLHNSRIKLVVPGEELAKKIVNTRQQLEYIEAVIDQFTDAYLGTLSIADAVVRERTGDLSK
ncbi:MAG: hypothetical protein ACXWC8_01060 [Limisphaerales bacterium]